MLDYLKGLIFVIIFIFFLSTLGKRIHKSGEFGENLIYGFIIYTPLQFVGGFVSQQLRLPWVIYRVYMVVIFILLICFCFYKNKIYFDSKKLSYHFKRYGVLYIIALIFVVLSCINIQYQWNANNVDDGYYLNKIRMAPYVGNFTDYNYAVGLSAPESVVRTINTFEIEAAFFCQMLGVDASIYAKVFLSLFNYTLVLHTIFWFYNIVLRNKKLNKYIAISIIPILFFCIYQELLANFGVLFLQDSWQFNTAMWYGSTLVRSIGLLLILTPLIKNNNKITKEYIVFFFLVCVTMFSKASQTLPLIIIFMAICFISKLFMFLKNRKGMKIAFLFLAIILLLIVAIPLDSSLLTRANVISELITKNMGSFVIKVCIFLIAVSYLLDIKPLKIWNNWILSFGLFFLVPRVNSLFLISSIYDFVAARTITLYFFTVIITAIIICFVIIKMILEEKRKLILVYCTIGLLFIGIPFISIQRNLGISNSIEILLNNPKLIPQSTLELGDALRAISLEKGIDLRILSPAWVVVDGTPHPLSSSIRYNDFDIISISAIPRYNTLEDTTLSNDYTEEVQEVYEFYHSGMDQDPRKLKEVLIKYNINCIISYYDGTANQLEEDFGYQKVGTVSLKNSQYKYTILYKEMS